MSENMIVRNPGLPVDETLPQLPVVLNPSAMQKMFEQALWSDAGRKVRIPNGQNRFVVENCSIRRIKYKPGKNCLILYRLDLQDRETKQVTTHTVCARVYEKGGARSRYRKALSGTLAPSGQMAPVHHLEKLDMVAWIFPNERKLRSISRLLDEDFLRKDVLPELILHNFGSAWHWHLGGLELVHYVPEHTCTIRLHLDLQDKHFGYRRTATVYGKTYYNDEGRDTFVNMLALWQSAMNKQHRCFARPLGYDAPLQTLWQLGVPGTPLHDEDWQGKAFVKNIARAALLLGRLHRQPLPYEKPLLEDGVQQKLLRLLQIAAHCHLPFQGRLAEVVGQLLASQPHLQQQPLVTLHGDLHLKNFIHDEGRVALIDLDNIQTGNAYVDLGSFLANILYQGMLNQLPECQTRKIVTTFIEYYQYAVNWSVDRDALRWWLSVALLNERVLRSITRLKEGRLQLLQTLVELAGDKPQLQKLIW